MYLNADQMNRDRLVVDDEVENEFSIFDCDSSSRYFLISLDMYREIKWKHEKRINKICDQLNPKDYERELLHLRREIRTVESKEKYLKVSGIHGNVSD